MSFGNPLAVLWGLLIVLVVVLYRHRIRLRREVVATDFLWERVFAEEPLRMAWQKYRHVFSLMVQILAMAMVVIALAEPLLPGPQRTVVVVDNSASMNATDVEPTRLVAAKETALKMVDGLRDCDRMAVLSAGGTVGVVCPMTSDKPTLREAIQSIAWTPKTTQMDAAVRLAGRMLAEKPGVADAEGISTEAIFHGKRRSGSKIVLLTDGRFDGAKELAAIEGVELVRVGEPTGNVAIARLEARRNIRDPRKCQLLIEVRSFSDQPIECPLLIYGPERTIERIPLKIQEGRWLGVFEFFPVKGRLFAEVDIDDKYPYDNKASIVIPPVGLHEALVITGDNYLKSVFSANHLVKAHFIPKPLPAMPPGMSNMVMVHHGQVPEQVPNGSILVIDPASSTDLWELGAPLEDVAIAKVDDTSPVMADVRLLGVRLPGASQIEPTDEAGNVTVLAENADGQPLILAIDRPPTEEHPVNRVVVLSGDLQVGSLARRTTFPILITNCLDWIAGIDHDVNSSAAPIDQPVFAEGNIRVPADLGIATSGVVLPKHTLPPWLYLVIAAAVILGLEYCLYQRRWMT